MAKYIKLGVFNKNYLYIIFCVLGIILKDCMYGFNYNESFAQIFDDKARENFYQFNLIRHIYCYLVTIILSFILFKYKNKQIQPEKLEKAPLVRDSISSQNNNEILQTENDSIKLIYQKKKKLFTQRYYS